MSKKGAKNLHQDSHITSMRLMQNRRTLQLLIFMRRLVPDELLLALRRKSESWLVFVLSGQRVVFGLINSWLSSYSDYLGWDESLPCVIKLADVLAQ